MLQSAAFQVRNCNWFFSVAFTNISGVHVGREGRNLAEELRNNYIFPQRIGVGDAEINKLLRTPGKNEPPGPSADTETLREPRPPPRERGEHQEQGVSNTLQEGDTSLYHCPAA